MTLLETRYAKSGDIHIAYQVAGSGPLNLVFVPGFISNLDFFWEDPGWMNFLSRLAGFSRLILFDKRGTGLSDRISGIANLEDRMDDVRAVMDAANCERAALFGISEGGPMSLLFAATYPERASAFVLYGSHARHPTLSADNIQQHFELIERLWGDRRILDTFFCSKQGRRRGRSPQLCALGATGRESCRGNIDPQNEQRDRCAPRSPRDPGANTHLAPCGRYSDNRRSRNILPPILLERGM